MCADQAKPNLSLTVLEAPAHGSSQVVLFELERGTSRFVAGPTDIGVRLPTVSKRRKEGGVLAANDICFTG
jgi:hypothetical protein